jgi:hypothetical protein
LEKGCIKIERCRRRQGMKVKAEGEGAEIKIRVFGRQFHLLFCSE